MITTDERCRRCTDKDIYRMIGSCLNCGIAPVLILYTVGHDASKADCPTCGNYWSVTAQRLATEDEIPAA